MIKTLDVLHLPRLVWLGRRGETVFRPLRIKWDDWHRDYPGATLSVIYHRPDGQDFIVATSASSPLYWTPQLDTTTVSGDGELEMHLVGDPEIGISASVETIVDDSRSNAPVESAPAWADRVVQEVTEQADRAEEAADSIGGAIDDAVAEAVPPAIADYLEEHPVTVTETDPTVPAWAKQPTKPTYTASEVGALPSDTVIPPAVTLETDPNDAVYQINDFDIAAKYDYNGNEIADTYATKTELSAKQNTISDLATIRSGAALGATSVQPSQMQTYVQQQIAAIPDELPAVTASDNGKFLRVVSGAWAAQAVPSAESNSF